MEKRLDYKGRWRNKTVAFHVSEEEGKLIDRCVSLSGLTKQEYIIRRLQCRDVVVQGNPRVYKALRNQMAEIYGELKRLEKCSGENDELLYTIQLIAQTMNGLKGENWLQSVLYLPAEKEKFLEDICLNNTRFFVIKIIQ